jgi:hypothetical protein
VAFFSKLKDDTTFQCGETNSESEESNEKSEKLKFSDDDYFNHKHTHHTLIFDPLEMSRLEAHHNSIFSSSDYSVEVYSPPELI